jgi:hypothetical protein
MGGRMIDDSLDSFDFEGDGVSDTIPKGTSKDIDFLVSEERFINGGMLYAENGKPQDYFSAKVVDKDNILGYGAGVVVSTWIKKFYLHPDSGMILITREVGQIPPGLYLRISYTSTGSVNDVFLSINYHLHKAKPHP